MQASVSQPDSAFHLAPLHGRAVHLWSVTSETSEAALTRFEEFLAPDEKMRADRFRFAHLRRSFVVARGALRTILGTYLGTSPALLRFSYGAQGKPALDPKVGLRFNASHSGDLAVFAVTLGCDLGVDVEHVRVVKDMEQVAHRFFCPDEAAELMSLPPADRQRAFFLCWTRKEAYIKATGEGLSAALDSFRVSLLPSEPARMIHIAGSREAARQWTMHHFDPDPTYQAALAYRDHPRPIGFRAVLDAAELFDL